MCTGLVTVALFFGSMKNTFAVAAFAFVAGFFACALAKTPNPATITSTGSTICLLSVISDLLLRGDILERFSFWRSATRPARESAAGRTRERRYGERRPN